MRAFVRPSHIAGSPKRIAPTDGRCFRVVAPEWDCTLLSEWSSPICVNGVNAALAYGRICVREACINPHVWVGTQCDARDWVCGPCFALFGEC